MSATRESLKAAIAAAILAHCLQGCSSRTEEAGNLPSVGSQAASRDQSRPGALEPAGAEKQISVDLGGGVKMEFILIPAGSFMMGDAAGFDREKPAHKVTISKPFYLGKYEVTQAQYQRVMGYNPSWFSADGGGSQQVAGQDSGRFPVEGMWWKDTVEFCRKLSQMSKGESSGHVYRLPTEAEWEYACRAGGASRFGFGDEQANLGDYAWWAGNADERTHPVGRKKPNPWGLYDMHGNVWEWCADWYQRDYYGQSPAEDPAGPADGKYRVLRGGSFHLFDLHYFRSAFRHFRPVDRYKRDGFRVARSLSP